MMPATTKAGGTCLAAPDVCKVPAPPAPPVPTPFPNTGQLATATGTCMNVMVENMDVVTEASKIPSSNGDEAGVAGGVVSGMNMGECTFKVASSKVFAAGKKVAFLTATTGQNGSNANAPAGVVVAPSQMVVLVGP